VFQPVFVTGFFLKLRFWSNWTGSTCLTMRSAGLD